MSWFTWFEQHFGSILGLVLVIFIPMILGVVLHLDHYMMKICRDNVDAIKKLNVSTESNYTTNEKYVNALMSAIDEKESKFTADNAQIEWEKDGKIKIVFFHRFKRDESEWITEYTIVIPKEKFKENIFDFLMRGNEK